MEQFVNNSLHSLITTGKGQPNPKDQEGEFNKQLLEKYFEGKVDQKNKPQ